MISYIPTTIADQTTYTYYPIGFQPGQIPIVKLPGNTCVQANLYGIISNEYTIVQPLQITIEQDDNDSFVVSDDIFLVYGDGNTKQEAIKEYVESLIEYFQLVENGAASNHFDKMLLSELQSYIQRRGKNAIQTDGS